MLQTTDITIVNIVIVTMKRVSLEVAKVLKEVGYPQGTENTAYYNENGTLVKPFVFNGGNEIADAPTYFEAWLWLWRKKNIRIKDTHDGAVWVWWNHKSPLYKSPLYIEVGTIDPEESIEKAIKHLVKIDLIK